MFSYCNQYEGSLGFVISKDSDIRSIAKVDGRVIIWKNIEIQKVGQYGGTTPNHKKGQ